MNKDERKIFNAMKHLSTVRKPVPEKIDESAFDQDMEKLTPLFEEIDYNVFDKDQNEFMKATVVLIVTIQRKFFNRSLWQITANSMADGILHVMDKMVENDEELGFLTYMSLKIAKFISENKLAMDSSEMGVNFLLKVEEQHPGMVDEIAEATESEDVEDADDNLNSLFTNPQAYFENNPVRLLDESQSVFYVQPQNIDFNPFIEQVYNKHSKAQILIAYLMFKRFNQGSLKILGYATRGEQIPGEFDIEAAEFDAFMAQVGNLNLNGVINFSKLFHQYLKFCQDNGLITAKEYRDTLRAGNDQIFRAVNVKSRGIYELLMHSDDVSKSLDKFFSKPNHTINVAEAKRQLSDLNWQTDQSVIEQLNFKGVLVVAKKLDEHQLELELKKAHEEMEKLWYIVPGLDTIDEIEQYEKFTLQIHTDMVAKYNRRLRRWTKESLIDCLENFFKNHPETYAYPAYFRYLELYLEQLDNDSAISSFGNLMDGLEIMWSRYLYQGINYYSAK